MIRFTQTEINFLNSYIKQIKRIRKLEKSLIKIIEKHKLNGEDEICGMLSNDEIESAEDFEKLLNEFL